MEKFRYYVVVEHGGTFHGKAVTLDCELDTHELILAVAEQIKTKELWDGKVTVISWRLIS
jgi:hypothetical protein